MDLDQMTPRELCAGLMRGDRVDMKRGYPPASAAMTAAERKGLSQAEAEALMDYAIGFANGMADAIERTDSSVSYSRLYIGMDSYEADYQDGLCDGRLESGFLLYPTLKEVATQA